ncbi:MAG TPA: tail fiber protein [Candidatus Baltobacteraceae bacterium]
MEVYIGMILLFAGNFAPLNFAFCNGQLLQISQYSALFSILGVTYGGDGTQNFALPDLRGRVPLHFGQGPGLSNYALGQGGGVENIALTLPNLPAHNHLLMGDNTGSGRQSPGPEHVLGQSNTDKIYSVNAPNTSMNARSIGMTGNNIPVPVLQPYRALNFVIALQGIYPSRN